MTEENESQQQEKLNRLSPTEEEVTKTYSKQVSNESMRIVLEEKIREACMSEESTKKKRKLRKLRSSHSLTTN